MMDDLTDRILRVERMSAGLRHGHTKTKNQKHTQ